MLRWTIVLSPKELAFPYPRGGEQSGALPSPSRATRLSRKYCRTPQVGIGDDCIESHFAMTLIEAQRNACQILDVERTAPTTNYMSPAPFVNQAAIVASALGQRGWHPRPVSEKPGYYFLQSRNYELLKSFYEDIAPGEHSSFLASLRQRISEPNPFKVIGQDVLGAGKTDRTNSELPLVAEFLVRQGDTGGFLQALPDAPLRPALTRLLLHVE